MTIENELWMTKKKNIFLGMKNKKHITVFDIPLGMYLSVERNNTPQKQHPVRDASLTGCKGRNVRSFSTERCIP